MARNSNKREASPVRHYKDIARRKFLGGCAACAGVAGLIGAASWLKAAMGIGRQGIAQSSVDKLCTMWDTWGGRPVTFHGDLRDRVYGLADELGWKVAEEA